MDYYGTMRSDFVHKQMYPTDHRTDYFPKSPHGSSSVKIVPKPNCIPRFTTKIEGNAVEEGERVFFEGIVDAQPHPVFSWYFNDEPVMPGHPGWEDAEIHDSRKMTTLILKYCREYHMGKYTLVAQNQLGHAVSNCDLIVRKKQFPPVFWQRLYNYEAEAGSRLVSEVEVGGWPVPSVTWFKDDEELTTKTHTENYNGFPNKYVPDSRVEVIRLDQIRHCVIFHRIGESDSGVYTVRAVNPLGEAVCEAEFIVVPGEGGAGDLYLPELWKNRSTWLSDDRRIKKFVNVQEPELTDEDIQAMCKRVGAPLPRALEYLASLPDYQPTPLDGLLDMPFTCEPSHVRRDGRKGGKPSRPSKFVAGTMAHSGYKCDTDQCILPWWRNPADRNAPDPNDMHYRSVRPDLKEPRPRPPDAEGPPCPHIWETHEAIDQLYQMLDTVGCRILVSDVRLDKLGNLDQQRRQRGESRSQVQVQAEARKQVMKSSSSQIKKFSYLSNTEDQQVQRGQTAKEVWKQRLEADQAAAQDNAQDFTNEFMHHQSDISTSAEVQAHLETSSRQELEEPPPALPPKTKIMFSPSRHLFSPTDDSIDDSDAASVNTVEYVPVKEKVKMIAQQQEEIVRREELRRRAGGEMLPGGVRILPPSPVTVRKTRDEDEDVAAVKHVVDVAEKGHLTTTTNDSKSQQIMYEAHAQVSSSSSNADSKARQKVMIPRLEDKYGVSAGLDELVVAETQSMGVASEESFASSHTVSSSHQSGYSSLMSASTVTGSTTAREMTTQAAASSTMKQSSQQSLISQQSSSKTMQDSSYSTASFSSSQEYHQHAETREVSSSAVQSQHTGLDIKEPKKMELTTTASHANPKPSWDNFKHEDDSPVFGSSLRKMNPSPPMPEPEPIKYRTPPSAPFQPGFYKKPVEGDQPKTSFFPLPGSPKAVRSTLQTSSSTQQSSSKRMRRRLREVKRYEGASSESDDEGGGDHDNDNDEEVYRAHPAESIEVQDPERNFV